MDGEIVARVERRRRWTPSEKAALLAEIDAAGGRVSVIARRHGVARSVLYNWRSESKAASLVADGETSTAAAGFVQLGVLPDLSPMNSARRVVPGATSTSGASFAVAERASVMEIDLPEGVRIRVDGGVDEQALRRVLSAVRGLR